MPALEKTPFDLLNTPIREGITLIEASAGTGKTFTISAVVLRLLLEKKVDDLSQILVVTFTDAATGELKKRLRKVIQMAARYYGGGSLPDDPFADFLRDLPEKLALPQSLLQKRAEKAGNRLDQASILTIHGFCARLLERAAFESSQPFDVELVTDPQTIVDRIARDYWHRTLASSATLSELAVDREWKLEDFLKYRTLYTRFPHTALIPEPRYRTITDALDALESVRIRLAERWDGEKIRKLADAIDFKKDNPLRDDKIAETFEKVRALIDGTYVPVLESLEGFLADKFFESIYQRCQNRREARELDEHSAILAIREIFAAVEDVRQTLLSDFLHTVSREYDEHRIQTGILTFDDQLTRVHEALTSEGNDGALHRIVGERYKAALIDEFQDTDLLQYDIFYALFSSSYLFYIGDPKQSIYSFRGADIDSYLEARERANRAHTLGKNYRSTPEMVDAINALFGHSPVPFLRSGIEYEAVGSVKPKQRHPLSLEDTGALVWWFVQKRANGKNHSVDGARDLLLAGLVEEITRLISAAPDEPLVRPRDIGILVRKHEEAQHVQKALASVGISSIVGKTGNIFQSDEATELLLIMSAVLSDRNAATINAALATILWGYDAVRICGLQNDEKEWQHIGELLQCWAEIWEQRGIDAMLRAFSIETEVYDRLLPMLDGERRLTNLSHLMELLHLQERESHATPDALVTWLGDKMTEEKADPDTTELRLESDRDAVRISTIHRAKGLEYPVVFAPFLWNPRVEEGKGAMLVRESPRDVKLAIALTKEEELITKADMRRLAEDARLTYVALTRAKLRCYIAWGHMGSKKGAQYAALAYLLHAENVGPDEAVPWYKKIIQALSDDDHWQSDLEAFVAAHTSCMSLKVLDGRPGQISGQVLPGESADSHATFSSRTLSQAAEEQLVPFEMSSFSGLTAHRHGTSEYAEAVDPDENRPEAPESPADIFSFAKGANTGLCWHALLEQWDFSRSIEQQNGEERIYGLLAQYGLDDPNAHEWPIDPFRVTEKMVRTVCSMPLPPAGYRLRDVRPGRRLNEWRFNLKFSKPISLQIFADALAGKVSSAIESHYLPGLRETGTPLPEGFLTGFADLIFEHEGRWHLIDWKSNHLGYARQDYHRQALTECMAANNYILQYHLYLLALHRYLTWRLDDYSYERHIGEVWYVFLRGLDPAEPNGIFHDRPPEAAIRSLDELFHEVNP